MGESERVDQEIAEVTKALVEADCFDSIIFAEAQDPAASKPLRVTQLESVLKAAKDVHAQLLRISNFLRSRVINRVLDMDRWIQAPEQYDKLRSLLERLLAGTEEFKREPGFVAVYADLLAVYFLVLYRCGSPGRESAIIRLMLNNVARRKAVESNQAQLTDALRTLEHAVTIAIIAKRYAVYVLATRGLNILFRRELEFRTYGDSPEALALQLVNILLKEGIKLTDVTDIVCAGGDLGTLPDGIYVLNETLRNESLKRLQNSSINRGALVAYELKEILAEQRGRDGIHASLASPLSFTTLESLVTGSFLKADSEELSRQLQGYVKVTPLKGQAALISEAERISQERLNLLVMSLDELFASVVRKTGPRIVRELAQQDANEILSKFDFDKIIAALDEEGFKIPPHFRLASRTIGTGVKEICELLMIMETGRISPTLTDSLNQVVDTYASRVAAILESSSTGEPGERPDYIVVTSMLALDPYFQTLFLKIRDRIDNPFTPIMCMDSLEHEYLIANHLFEMYVNPAKADTRLQYTVEAGSIKHALQVLGASGGRYLVFSFSSLLEQVTSGMAEGRIGAGQVVLVGADNEDALVAVSHAKDYGLIKKTVLIGTPDDIKEAVERAKLPIALDGDPDVQLLPIDPLANDVESKKQATAHVFSRFLADHRDFFVMKGSVSTSTLLHEALAIYKAKDGSGPDKPPVKRRIASHTALFVLPDGRFFALSDAGVNPGFTSPEALLTVIENQADIIRKVVDPKLPLKVAIVTAVEKQTAAIPATHLAAQTMERATELEAKYGPIIVEGPLSFDLATVPDVAGEKHYEGRIMGDANCLVATDINTANVIYKMLSKTMGSLGLVVDCGGIITAGPGSVPIVLTSRGDTAQTKFNSILLALAYCAGEACLGVLKL
jgi:phosphate butyryltransferase